MNTKATEEAIPLYWEGNAITLLPLPYAIERLDPATAGGHVKGPGLQGLSSLF